MLIRYARVPTDEQDTTAQVAALKTAGRERIYREKASGGRCNRPELHRLLDQLRKSDVPVVWRLDRLSRSLRDVLTIMERLAGAKAGFRSLTEAIDTTTPAGRMMMQMVGAFAEFERAMLRERTKAGLNAARQDGRIGGRRPKLSPQQPAEIRKMVSRGNKTAGDAGPALPASGPARRGRGSRLWGAAATPGPVCAAVRLAATGRTAKTAGRVGIRAVLSSASLGAIYPVFRSRSRA
jgi:DNA invertase Pin-like site-specific DNA recombinase